MKQHIEKTEKYIKKLKKERSEIIRTDPTDRRIKDITREMNICIDLVRDLTYRLELGGKDE